MYHSIPVWKVEPVEDEDDLIDQLLLKKYAKEIAIAREQAKRGETYTSEEVRKNLGL